MSTKDKLSPAIAVCKATFARGSITHIFDYNMCKFYQASGLQTPHSSLANLDPGSALLQNRLSISD